MKSRLFLKLFFLTLALCMLMVGGIYVGQTLFFDEYYESSKIGELSDSMDEFQKEYLKLDDGERANHELERSFHQETNAWITVLDEKGYVKTLEDYTLTITGGFVEEGGIVANMDQEYTIPLAYLENSLSDTSILEALENYRDHVLEVKAIAKGDELYPYEMVVDKEHHLNNRESPFEIFDGGIDSYMDYMRNRVLDERIDHTRDQSLKKKILYGKVDATHTPEQYPFQMNPLLSNRVFLEQVKAFQADLLLRPGHDPVESSPKSYERNGVSYKILVDKKLDEDGKPLYFISMTSLQPIDEAMEMLKDYYIYVIIGAVILALLGSFYYSKKITQPLVNINKTAKDMANLQFEQRIPIKTSDEIGELSESINNLSDNLHRHINQLQHEIQKEKQLEHTRKNFIAGVSHELKTPLSIIQSCTAILQDGLAKDRTDHYFEAINREVSRMDRLIVDMLELAKYESGTFQLQPEAFPVKEAIQNVFNQLMMKIQEKDLQIHMDVADVTVLADQHRIEQVLSNFLSNAIKHTPPAGQVTIEAHPDGDHVRISIINEGEPIEDTQLKRIWDQFYQEKKAGRAKDGTGLGLAIAKNILKLHDAEYSAQNTDNGVCFSFTLKVHTPHESTD